METCCFKSSSFSVCFIHIPKSELQRGPDEDALQPNSKIALNQLQKRALHFSRGQRGVTWQNTKLTHSQYSSMPFVKKMNVACLSWFESTPSLSPALSHWNVLEAEGSLLQDGGLKICTAGLNEFAFLHTVWVNVNGKSFILDALPQSFVMVGGSQGLALMIPVGSGSIYLFLMGSRWACVHFPVLHRLAEASGLLTPGVTQRRVDAPWKG